MGLSLHIFIVPVILMVISLQVWLPLGCIEEERIALLQLKDSLNYPNGTSLPSWRKDNAHCCDWESILCNNNTGQVTELILGGVRNGELGDWYLNASLFLPFQELNYLDLMANQIAGWVKNKGVSQPFKMSKLEYLDLSYNRLNNSILSDMDGLSSLKTLDISYNRLEGSIDLKGVYQPFKMSKLEYLDLSCNRLDNSILSYLDGLLSLKTLYLGYNRLEGLIDLKECPSNLETLSLGDNNITKVVASGGPTNLSTLYLYNVTAYGNSFQTLLQSLGAFPNLTTLSLGYNDLRGRILGDELRNLSSLEELVLDGCSLDENSIQSLGAQSSLKNLSLQELSGVVPFQGFLNLKNLELLDLSYNTLNSNNIFQTIRTMTSLKTLSLLSCNLNGQLPTGLCDLNHLQELNMHDNNLSGFLPPCLANLTSLQQLDISSNHLKIPMSLSPLYNLSKLKDFYGPDNEIYAEEDDHNLSPKFQLESLYLSGHGQGAGAFPKFLYHQFNLYYLDLTNIHIKGEFPSWLIENNTYLQDLSLENCSLSGPFLLPRSYHVNLSSLSISMNNFQGQIPAEIGVYLLGLQLLLMSNNGFNGSIPSSLGSMSSLQVLDLSNNNLTGRMFSNNSLQGQVPGGIGNMSSLIFLDLSANNLFGPLPPRFGASSKLRYVYLSRNKLQGPITTEFYDSSGILALDLSHNNFTGRIPEWIGRLSNLRFLLLSHNNLKGEIPIQLCRLDQLTLIDLSHNYLSGNILSWMISSHPFPSTMSTSQQSFEFTTKNVPLLYEGNIIQYFTGIDFSCNNFTGEIPPEIGNLSKIKVLNLSHNSLIGPIPRTFSNLKEIESLDLSYNKLEGEIPPQLTGLYSLAVFSVSHNNLSGKTPARVAQFATFEESSYKDNTFLCGQPLPKACGPEMPPSPESQVMTLSGCESYCGVIRIPYPFGMKEGCFLDERFKIHCNSSSGVPTLTVNGTDLVVRSISVDDSTIYVKFPMLLANCGAKDRNTVVDLEGSPFVFSSENYFVATGCNNLALMNQNNSAIGGCVSICDEKRDLLIAGCSGINCCQTRIPSNLKVFNVTMTGVDGRNGSGGEKNCRHAYLSYYGRYPSDMKDVDSVGAVLDWGIDRRLFESLVKNGSYYSFSYTSTCKDMNTSIDSTIQSPIVQCFCKTGFEGNPYLFGNCQEGTTYRSYRRKIKAKMAGIGVGVGFVALFLFICLWWLYKVFKRKRSEKRKKRYFKRNGGLLLQEQLSSGEVNVEKIKMFLSKELDKATDHYNANRMLGQGGQGTVYKGMLADGKIVAVKKSKVIDEGNLRQFINEVVLLSQINHRNVVKLLGCCLETELPLLVFEFIPNGTLFQFLHDPNEEFPLTWEMRLRIAAEVAGALFYLHSAASIAIFHRDIKSTNILLDDKYRAKVADFGTSRSVSVDQTHVTTLVQGTFGYLDPEYFQSSQFTDKSDVYSFGVVLIELLTGQKPISFTRSEEQGRSLATYFLMAMESNCLFDILDPQVVKQGKKEDVLMVASLARSCLRLNGKERPTMKEVTMVFERIQKSDNLIVQQEIEYDRNEVMGAPCDATSTSTIFSFGISASSSLDDKPLLHTY